MESARRIAPLFGLVALLAACGGSPRLTYSGRLYSVAQVKAAFSQLGLRLSPGESQPGAVRFHVVYTLSHQPAGRAGTLVVATRRSAVGSTSLGGQEIDYANVAVFTKSRTRDEIKGALSALRWGTLARGTPGDRVIVPGKSIGLIRLGERRKAVERALGPGTETRRGFVSYVGGRLVVDYWFHDTLNNWVESLSTTSPGFHTRSGIHIGSNRQQLRRLYATCAPAGECYLLQGPWPDALATSFTMHGGRVAEISMGYS